MPNVFFSVDNLDYKVKLSTSWITIEGKDRKTCECVILCMNPIRAFAGVSIKHPNDGMKFDAHTGYRIAFKRALLEMYIVQQFAKNGAPRHSILAGWSKFFERFRVPFGKALHETLTEDFPF